MDFIGAVGAVRREVVPTTHEGKPARIVDDGTLVRRRGRRRVGRADEPRPHPEVVLAHLRRPSGRRALPARRPSGRHDHRVRTAAPPRSHVGVRRRGVVGRGAPERSERRHDVAARAHRARRRQEVGRVRAGRRRRRMGSDDRRPRGAPRDRRAGRPRPEQLPTRSTSSAAAATTGAEHRSKRAHRRRRQPPRLRAPPRPTPGAECTHSTCSAIRCGDECSSSWSAASAPWATSQRRCAPSSASASRRCRST